MPIFRNRPLLPSRPRRYSVDLQKRVGLLLGTQGLLSDSFDRRATVASSDGFDGYGDGLPWTVQSGAFACATGRLTCSSAGIITVDPGVADAIRFEFQLAFTTNANSNSFVLRFTDTSNYLRLVFTSSAIQFQTVIAGTPAAIGSGSTGVSPANGDVVIGSLIGNAFAAQVYRAGVPVGTAATVASNSTGAGQTAMGFRTGDTACAIGYLKVRRSS